MYAQATYTGFLSRILHMVAQESYRFLYSEYKHMLLARILHGYWQECYMKKMIRFIDKISLCTLLSCMYLD